jgi:hypothetical protein
MLATPPAARDAGPHAAADAGLVPLYGKYLLAVAAALIGNLIVRIGGRGGWLPSGAQAAIAALAVLPLLFVALTFRRAMRRDLDELMQRILLEGMAFALMVYIPVAALVVNLRTAGVAIPRLDPPDLLLSPALLVAIGVALAWRRYQ